MAVSSFTLEFVVQGEDLLYDHELKSLWFLHWSLVLTYLFRFLMSSLQSILLFLKIH